MLVGARFFPWLIIQIAHTKSRELLSLGTLALALGVAWAAYFWFDASFALGAFLGGLALNGTRFSHKVAEDSLPLRDTFAVLFFVAVGMLFDPGVHPARAGGAGGDRRRRHRWARASLAYVLMRMMKQSPQRQPDCWRSGSRRSANSPSCWPGSALSSTSCRPRPTISSSPAP